MTTRRQFVRLTGVAGLAAVGARGFAQVAPVQPGAPVGPAPVTPVAPAAPVPAASAPAVPATPAAPAGPLVSESEPQAVAVGYVNDAQHADLRRFPSYHPGQRCANCRLFQGAPAATQAPCAFFNGRSVLASGWCSAHQLRIG